MKLLKRLRFWILDLLGTRVENKIYLGHGDWWAIPGWMVFNEFIPRDFEPEHAIANNILVELKRLGFDDCKIGSDCDGLHLLIKFSSTTNAELFSKYLQEIEK